ncbi:MAG: hypothetical protein RL235_1102 [Chlamydiota bacterium]
MLGSGTWGFALATLLGSNGHTVTAWARNPILVKQLQTRREHPKLPGNLTDPNVHFVSDIEQALERADIIIESVTSAGIRSVFSSIDTKELPIVVTSKGIEQKTGLLLPEVIADIIGEPRSKRVGCLSGPSHAEEVMRKLPTSVVSSGYDMTFASRIMELFITPTFRVYPNSDIHGVCFGGAMKNIIAIACGISDGLGSGDNAKAALMTRGLHEIRKLCVVKQCRAETLNGLSGMGDLCVTCMSTHSRNYRFGRLIAEGLSPEGARQKVGMAVEGVYSCVSARELGIKYNIPVPITEVTYDIIYSELDPREAMKKLMQRAIKEEHL